MPNNVLFESHIKNVPDFPKEGVVFKDITELLKNEFNAVITEMCNGIDWEKIDLVAGIESRGFILGAAMAAKMNKGLVPIRKKNKLPPPVIFEQYELEYGTDQLELQVNNKKAQILVVDDVIATGGTLKAALKLCERNNYKVAAVKCLIDLKFLNKLSEEFDFIDSVLNYE